MKFGKFIYKTVKVIKYFSILCIGAALTLIIEYGFELDFIIILGLSVINLYGTSCCIRNFVTDEDIIMECDYDGQTVYCPDCGQEIIIEFDTARCDKCGWMVADAELDEIMNEN